MDTSVKLCMGCMNELDANGVCHYCSYTDDMPHLQSYLAPRTVLDNRYIVGKMLTYNGEGASYICYDTIRKAKAVVREYMPDTLCERERGTQRLIVNPDCLAKYKTYMSEFADMNKTLSRMRNLSHISTAMDMFVENNTTYVILEYVEGVSLKKFLQSNTGYLTWNQVKKLFVPLFTTLSIIHNAGIIHRGISPENIIVTTDGELKLTGFSISSIRTSNTGLSPEFYSGYTAPEQYSSLEYQGTWTDVYAIAAVLYRILTGCAPLDANTRIYNDTLVDACRINPNIPVHISNVISRAMAVRGEERIQSVNELVTELFSKHTHIEHQKGATQTIPIQKVNQRPKRTQTHVREKKAEPEKKTSPAVMALGITMLVVFLALGVFLLYQLLGAPSAENNDSENALLNSAYISGSQYDASSESSGTDSVIIEESEPDDSYPYGVGSIMPNVVGMRYETVMKQLGNDFNIRAEYFYSDTEEKGIITEQNIPEGSEYDPELKNELVLKVCKGTENVPVPDYSGLSYKDYSAILDSLDIKYKKVEVESSRVTIGYVVSTDIGVGYNINVKEGETLTVNVSIGMPQPDSSASSGSAPDDSQSGGSESQNRQSDDAQADS